MNAGDWFAAVAHRRVIYPSLAFGARLLHESALKELSKPTGWVEFGAGPAV